MGNIGADFINCAHGVPDTNLVNVSGKQLGAVAGTYIHRVNIGDRASQTVPELLRGKKNADPFEYLAKKIYDRRDIQDFEVILSNVHRNILRR